MEEKVVIGYRVDGQVIDIQTAKELGVVGEDIYFGNSEDALKIIRHSTAHLMAQAIKQLYPEAKFYVGPVIEDGFYYDFKVDKPISDKE